MNRISKKIVFTGGGSAGHVTPNIAIIDLLQKKDHQVFYIGRKNGIERGLIEPLEIPYYGIQAGKLRRYFDFKNFTDVFRIIAGFFQALFMLLKIRPQAIFSKGGFVACPVVWAGWLLRIPVVIHESDISPGLANKLSLPFARKICLNFEESKTHVNGQKAVLTGLPIRQSLLHGNQENGLTICGFTNSLPVILMMGGSQGAVAINEVLRESLDDLLGKFQLCHLCGKGNKKAIEKEGYFQLEYAKEELPDLLAMSDLVISRAGATSIFEFLSLKKPNLLIPLPKSASRGDQILNAAVFEKAGYSNVLFQEDMSVKTLLEGVEKVYQNREIAIQKMTSSKLANATANVVNAILDATKN